MASDFSNLTRGDSYRLAASGRASQRKLLNKPRKEDLNQLRQELDIGAHRIPINDLYYSLSTDPDVGLTNNDARLRLAKYGRNVLSPIYTIPDWVIFCKNLFGGFSLLLWIGAVLCFIAFGIQAGAYLNPPMDNLWLGVVLVVIILLSATFSFYQETKCTKILESFEKMVPYKANVIRDGFTYDILAEDLVVGDIINVKCGDRIPADIRIISANSFKVDNSALTGESNAQSRSAEYTNENSLETKNLAFFSTNAVEGSCKGVVIHIGDGTVMGRIANLASGVEAATTPIAKEISLFIYIVTIISVILALIFITAAFLLSYYWIDSIIFLIAIIIACVPEGLLATVTVCLTLTAKKMASKNCLVKHLEAVETLGCTKVICCDKTGTLTQNKMTVSHLWFDNYLIEVELVDNELLEGFDTDAPTWAHLSRAIMLCNHSEFLPSLEGEGVPIMQRNCSGDASEAALLRFMEVVNGNVDRYQNQNTKVYEMPFNSDNKYQFSIHETDDDHNEYLLILKGAPEKILEYCDIVIMDGNPFQINNEWRSNFLTNYEQLGAIGERVIGFAEKRLSASKFPRGFDFAEEEFEIPPGGMQFIGLVSMVDPPRSAVPDAVEKCRMAGIKVVMITGDHPVTAKAIAKAVGIIGEGRKTVEDLAIERGVRIVDVDPRDAKACVVHGNELSHMTADQLDLLLLHHDEIVFARTTPHQKLLIVEGFQRLGNVVAVTGDGVNDSPALKKADIGIAMGMSGSDVSKQAADMILLDDNFASIVTGIEEGRIIFDNLKKSICYTLTSNIPELAPLLLFIIAGIPMPLGTIAILLIDLGTDILPAIALAYEEAETDNMKRDPRNPKTDRLITHNLLAQAFGQIGIIETAAGFFTYFIIMAECGFWPLRLLGLRQEWDSMAINDVMDSYGQEWSYRQRKRLEYTCVAGFFVAIVMTQWTNLIICKTKRNSVFDQGLDNHYLTGSLFISATLAIIFVYVPGLNVALRLQPLRFTWWLPTLPYLLMIVIYDELRKFIVRNGLKRWKRENI